MSSMYNIDRRGRGEAEERRPVPEFKEFEPRFKTAKPRFKLNAGLNLETFDTILSGSNHI